MNALIAWMDIGPGVCDRLCMRGLFIRLVIGSSRIEVGVFDCLETEALASYDRVIELDLADVAIDGSLHEAPCGGEGTGKRPVDKANLAGKSPPPY